MTISYTPALTVTCNLLYYPIRIHILIYITEDSIRETSRLSTLTLQLKQYKNDKLILKNTLYRQNDLEQSLIKSKLELKQLYNEYNTLLAEHNNLTNTFEEVIIMTRDQSNILNEQLEMKLRLHNNNKLHTNNTTTYTTTNDNNSISTEDRLEMTERQEPEIGGAHLSSSSSRSEGGKGGGGGGGGGGEYTKPSAADFDDDNISASVSQSIVLGSGFGIGGEGGGPETTSVKL